jgi:hypothetical protein
MLVSGWRSRASRKCVPKPELENDGKLELGNDGRITFLRKDGLMRT